MSPFTKELRVGDFKLGTQRIHNVSTTKDVNLTLDLKEYRIDGMFSVSIKHPWSPPTGWVNVKFQFNTVTKLLVLGILR